MVPPRKKKTALLPSSPKESPCKSPNLEFPARGRHCGVETSVHVAGISTCELLVIEPAYIAEAINIGAWAEVITKPDETER